jgi:hypothetical protein
MQAFVCFFLSGAIAMDRETENLSGVASVIQDIVAAQGAITAQELVDAARPADSPAHSAFEWDDSIAGENWRKLTARKYIRITKVDFEDRREQLIHVPAIKSNEPGQYKPISVVVQNIDEFQLALSQLLAKQRAAASAVAELRRAAESTNRKAAIHVLDAVADAMDSVVCKLESIAP